jgi:hypothetical protein
MSEWQPSWTEDLQSGFFVSPAEYGGFLIASETTPRFCFFATTIEEARAKAKRSLRYYARKKIGSPK